MIDPSLVGTSAGATAAESISAGDLVSIYSDVAGYLYVQRAWAGTGPATPPSGTYPLQAVGFVQAAAVLNDKAQVVFSGLFTQSYAGVTGSMLGAEVYLSATAGNAGKISLDRPGVTGRTGPLDQTVGYVLAADTFAQTLSVNFIAGFNDFSRISGVCGIGQGGTDATTATQAVSNLGSGLSEGPNLVWASPTGATGTVGFRALDVSDLSDLSGNEGPNLVLASTTGSTGPVGFRALDVSDLSDLSGNEGPTWCWPRRAAPPALSASASSPPRTCRRYRPEPPGRPGRSSSQTALEGSREAPS